MPKRSDDLIEVLKDVGGLKPEQVDPFAGYLAPMRCPFCSFKCQQPSTLDWHIDYVHNSTV